MEAPPRRQGGFGTALAGGIVGSALTAVLLFFATPALLSSKIVRQGLLADPQILNEGVQALRDAQYAPVLADNRAAIEAPFASSWKGAAKPEVTLVEFFDYACPYCKASNPAIDRLLQEDKGLRVVYRELPIPAPTASPPRGFRCKPPSSGVLPNSTTRCGKPAGPLPTRSRKPPRAPE